MPDKQKTKHELIQELDLLRQRVADLEQSELAHKQTEEALRRQAQIMDQVHDAIIATDLEGFVSEWNTGAERMFGYSAEEALGKPVSFIYPEDQRSFLAEGIVAPLRQKGWHVTEARVRSKSGKEFPVHLSLALLKDSKGVVVGMVGASIDITERKQAEDMLQVSNKRFSTLSEYAPIPLWEEDLSEVKLFFARLQASGVRDFRAHFENHPQDVVHCANLTKILGVNQKGLDFWGISSKEELPPNLSHYFVEESIDEFKKIIIDLAEGKTRLEGELSLQTKKGDLKVAAIRTSVLPGSEETLSRVLVSLLDITERKRLEEQTRQYTSNLERIIEERTKHIQELERKRTESEKLAATGRMAVRIAHEINNPLAGIKNSFQLIKDAVLMDHPYYKYVGRIESEINRIANIVHQMFDLNRPEKEPMRKLSIDNIIHDVITSIKISNSNLLGKKVAIEIEPHDPPIAVTLQENLFRQILNNLLLNAIDASPPGKVVKIGVTRVENILTLTVSDHGRGIPQEVHSQIFEPFFTTKGGRSNTSLGLGLSICKNLVELIGGSIDFTSEMGKGTVFRVVLPIRGINN